MWSVVLIGLRWYDHQVTLGNGEDAGAFIIGVLSRLVPLFIHECRAHVCRAQRGWVLDKKRPLEVKNLGDAISRLVKHTAYTMASIASVTISIACVASIVVLLEREAIYLPAFGAGATTREHRDDEEMIRRIAKEQQSLRRTAASLLHLRSDEELRTSIAVEMEFNDKEYKQSFSGGRAATRVKSNCREI